jgi:hypothetical protein
MVERRQLHGLDSPLTRWCLSSCLESNALQARSANNGRSDPSLALRPVAGARGLLCNQFLADLAFADDVDGPIAGSHQLFLGVDSELMVNRHG